VAVRESTAVAVAVAVAVAAAADVWLVHPQQPTGKEN